MSYARLVLPAAVLMLMTLSGCAGGGYGGSARMIQSSSDGGIVAIPTNNNSWPYNYRDHAEKLMAMHCPNGYSIVSEQEVIVGQKPAPNPADKGMTPAGYTENPGQPTGSSLTRNLTITSMKEYWITFRAQRPTTMATVSGVPK